MKPSSIECVFLVTFLVSFLIVSAYSAAFDPYQTLGLKRGASVQDIRKAYKQKAKEWYSCSSKFYLINQHY